jgi:SAM-dependent methyltransferase
MSDADGEYAPSIERLRVEEYASGSVADYLIYLFHVATYEFARDYVTDRSVLDFGCGTGYGTHALADSCREIVGVDIAPDAIDYARVTYTHPNLSYVGIRRVEDAPLPFPDERFDVVLSFQVIEHVADVDAYLREVQRVLAPAGTFICATPERATRLFPKQRPWNLYHLHEYGEHELGAELRRHFPAVELFGMTADRELLDVELRRCRSRRLATYPLTFPGAPESLRRAGLRALNRLQARRRRPDRTRAPGDFGFDHTAIRIAPGAEPSTNIVAVATNGG